MDTRILEVDPSSIKEEILAEGSKILKNGGTVAFPTETVYGLGANGLDPNAVKKIFIAKGRPADNPLILHIANPQDVEPLVMEIPEVAIKLMETFWPGPLTLLMKKSSIVPKETTGGLDTVGIRIPQHPIARKLIEGAGVPVAAPSANVSGKPSPTKAEHVIKDLTGKVDAIVAGGNSDVGVESTVLDLTVEPPTILRPGGITKEMLEMILPEVAIDPALEDKNFTMSPKSPGMKYTHYAPKADVTIIKGQLDKVVDEMMAVQKKCQSEGRVIGVICTDETEKFFGNHLVKSMGSRSNPKEIAANLFRILREFDETDVEVIIAEAVEETGLGQAIMNRLMKAAGHRVLEV
uniref:L-threonylcarbamoyladenylate synthase n=1 Tax=Alkaliphilus hydrothermalis TaxID=1482730 RepID=UPI00195DB828